MNHLNSSASDSNSTNIFIETFGLKDEFSPNVSIHEITLNCNSEYKYGQKISKNDQERYLLADRE